MTTASFDHGPASRRAFCELSAIAALFLALAATAAAQTPVAPPAAALTLTAALREAEGAAFQNRIAAAGSDADRARAALPLKGILPSMRVEAGAIRTTDPIGAFGTLLRQRQVTPAAFDPARLNDPAPITNVQGGLVLEVPLLNADAWTGRRAALAAASATDANGQWTAVGVRANVVRAYYGAVLAGEQVRTLELALVAAEAAVRQVQSMVQQGMVTKADALQASVHALDVSAQLLSARNESQNAREQLALLLGRTDGSAPLLPATLPEARVVQALAARDTLGAAGAAGVTSRADVRAARDGVAAARADGERAARTLLPRVNSFARYDWFAPTALFGGKPNWTVGVMASWSVFGGGSELADVAGTRARAQAAQAGHEAALAQGKSESAAAARGVALALQRLDLATRAAEQSREAQRLVQKRYAGGLATIAELLGADATATARALAQSAAGYAVIDALATRRRAIGADPAELRALDSER